MNIPQAVLTHNNTLLPLVAVHLSKKSVSSPLVKSVPNPLDLRRRKSFHRRAACLVHGFVFLLNDEYEMLCYSRVYGRQLQSVCVDIPNSHNPLPCPSQSNSMELAELREHKQTNSYAHSCTLFLTHIITYCTSRQHIAPLFNSCCISFFNITVFCTNLIRIP